MEIDPSAYDLNEAEVKAIVAMALEELKEARHAVCGVDFCYVCGDCLHCFGGSCMGEEAACMSSGRMRLVEKMILEKEE